MNMSFQCYLSIFFALVISVASGEDGQKVQSSLYAPEEPIIQGGSPVVVVAPFYPKELMSTHVSVDVDVSFEIDKDGKIIGKKNNDVDGIKFWSQADQRFVDATRSALMKWRFSAPSAIWPDRTEPVERWPIALRFRFQGDSKEVIIELL